MRLFEVKNDIAKIVYNPAENHLLPSDCLLLEDSNQKLIAQIINISTTETSDNNIADVRLSLSIDKEDNLSYYNGYIPSKNSSVIYINPDEIIELLKGAGETLYFGNLSNHSECFVKLSTSFLDDKLYVQSDRDDKTKTVIQNIVSELYKKQRKVILLDFDGRYSSLVNIPRIKISDSFKLPLNIEAFNTILEYDTVDCPIEDKAVIQSIVLELREYLKTIENKFLPFTLFKNVVDNEFMANPISGLMLLRNKLWLYAQDSIFAESKSQFDIINSILDNQNIVIVDASTLEEKWYKFAIQTILELVNKRCYFALSLNDVPMDKKAIVSLYNTPNIIPIVSTTYDSKYRQVLKSVCKNQILFKPSNIMNDEDSYNLLLNKINSSELIVYGESTLYLPLILELQAFDSSTNEKVVQNEIKKDVDKLLSSPQTVIPSDVSIVDEIVEEDDVLTKVIDSIPEVLVEDDDINDSDMDFLDEQNEEKITIEDIRNKQPIPIIKEDTDKEYDIFTPMSVDSRSQENKLTESIDDTDDLLQEEVPSNGVQSLTDNVIKPMGVSSNVVEEEAVSASETDIVVQNDEDFEIELELDKEDVVEKQEDAPPPINENVSTKKSPELTVYETDETNTINENDMPFKIGDRVYHPKHGNGVIEGFANYSNKILFCQIDFENVGRRILDPRVSGIEKIS